MVARSESASAGLLPVVGTYEQVRIGSLIQGRKATNDDVWEIIDLRHPAQFDHRTSPWFLAVNKATGEQVSIPPKPLGYACTFMVPEGTVDPDVEKPRLDPSTVGPPSPLSDGDEVALLVEALGARVVATLDHETKIWHCPPYEEVLSPDPGRQAYLDHIEVCHGIDVSAIKDGDIADVVTLHGNAHGKNFSKPRGAVGGFPHVHDYRDQSHFGRLT